MVEVVKVYIGYYINVKRSSLSLMVSGNFDLVKSFSAKMSWGKVTVYVLVRKNNRALLFTEVPYFAADEHGAVEANST